MRRIAPLLAAAIAIAGCGSSNRNNNAGAGKRADALAFANCMRSNGVPNFPDPGSNGHGGIELQAKARSGSGPSLSVNGVPVNGPAFQKANQACRKYLPHGGQPSAAQLAKIKAQALAMSRCMRSHGVPNFPDPQFGTGPGGGFGIRIGGPGSKFNPSSPAFQRAQQACGSLIGLKGDRVAAGP